MNRFLSFNSELVVKSLDLILLTKNLKISKQRKNKLEVQIKKGRIFFLSIILLCFLSSLALANGLNLNSLGTRALTMGGAFVGLADDFSAIYWNPAGIAQFDTKYFGFYGTDIIPANTYKLVPNILGIGEFTLVDAETERRHYLSGLAAYYYPVSENVVAGLGVYVPSGLGAKWNGDDFVDFHPVSSGTAYNWKSKIGLVTIAPAIAYRVMDKFYVGAALNINYGKFDIAMHAGSGDNPIPPPDKFDLGQYEENMNGWGYGATVGILFKPNEMFSLGATFRTASKVKFKGEASISNLNLLFGISETARLERDVTWPMWLAAGVAFKPMDGLTLTGDIQWTQWSKIDFIETDYKDTFWRLLMEESGDDKRPMYWNDALQIRFGAEYRINTIAIRGGYYYDPSPAPDRTMNVLLPNYDFNVFTVGFGYALNGLQLDFGLEYFMAKERSVSYEVVSTFLPPFFDIRMDPDYASAMPGTYDMKIIVPTISISYKF